MVSASVYNASFTSVEKQYQRDIILHKLKETEEDYAMFLDSPSAECTSFLLKNGIDKKRLFPVNDNLSGKEMETFFEMTDRVIHFNIFDVLKWSHLKNKFCILWLDLVSWSVPKRVLLNACELLRPEGTLMLNITSSHCTGGIKGRMEYVNSDLMPSVSSLLLHTSTSCYVGKGGLMNMVCVRAERTKEDVSNNGGGIDEESVMFEESPVTGGNPTICMPDDARNWKDGAKRPSPLVLRSDMEVKKRKVEAHDSEVILSAEYLSASEKKLICTVGTSVKVFWSEDQCWYEGKSKGSWGENRVWISYKDGTGCYHPLNVPHLYKINISKIVFESSLLKRKEVSVSKGYLSEEEKKLICTPGTALAVWFKKEERWYNSISQGKWGEERVRVRYEEDGSGRYLSLVSPDEHLIRLGTIAQ